ncbi:hypothetical protein KPL74_14055 [Bacillus sp. NP157]|nr:hypothetical protein KPL74_14055 [Bacillus sp. NP157]
MARYPRMLAFSALLATMAAQATDTPTLRYTIKPVLANDALTALDVTLDTQVGSDGTLALKLGGKPEAIRSDATLDTGTAGIVTLKAAPGARVSLHYRKGGAADLNGDIAVEPLLTAGWAHGPCGGMLAVPNDATPRLVELGWTLPKGWRGVSSVTPGKPVAGKDLAWATCMVGSHLADVTRPIGTKGTLHVYTADPAAATPLVDLVAKALAIIAREAGGSGVDYPMFVSTVNEPGEGFSEWNAGGFMAVMQRPGADVKQMLSPILQDYSTLVAPPTKDPSIAWYTKGLRSYLAINDLLAAGTLSRRDVASYLDNVSETYGNSAFRRASNAQVASDWETSPDIQALPALRGVLFGWLLDAQLRQATGGKACLADVLHKIPLDSADPAAALVAGVKATGGGDIAPLVDRYIVRGELLQLPPGALGPCMSVTTAQDGYGWQVQRITDTCTASTTP